MAPSGAPDPFRLLPEVPEGISLCFTFGAGGETVLAEAYAASGGELAGSGPVIVGDKDHAEAFALAAAVAIYNAKGAMAAPAQPAPHPAAPEAAPEPTPDATGAATLLQQIAALPQEWQDYLSTMFAAEYGVSLVGDDTMALTQPQIDFLAALLPQ